MNEIEEKKHRMVKEYERVLRSLLKKRGTFKNILIFRPFDQILEVSLAKNFLVLPHKTDEQKND